MAVTREQVAELFAGTFNRAPLSEGLDYWTSSDFTVEMVANSFFDQAETQAIYTNDGEPISSQQFVIRIFDNLFNRLPAVAGLEYWANALDSGNVSQGEMISAVMNGATGDDATILANKTAAGLYYADQGGTDTDFSLKNIDETEDSLTNAMAAIDSELATSTDFELTAESDRITGTSSDDAFEAAITQNPWAGGVSNTLSTADRLDGGAGSDSLYAELVPEFYGVTGDNQMDVQPRIQSIEDIQFEAMDVSSAANNGAITVDAKNITDVVKIGSTFSDGDLRIENLTTLTASGSIRNTEDITIVMDHTDNFDSDRDASDLTVLFDEDYLVSGQTAEAAAHYFLLDEDAELNGLAERLNRINVDGIRFTLGDPAGDVMEISDPAALTSLTHEAFVAALQDELQALIDDGTLPAGSTLTLDPTITDTTGLDDGSISNTIPAIVLTSGDGTIVTPVGYSQVEDTLGNYDVYGQFSASAETANNPITVNVELEKVGRDGEGGDLIIGGKDLNINGDSDVDQTDGISVFNIDVNGNEDQPSNLGTVRSTNQSLDTVNISNGDNWEGADLTIRDVIGGGQELTLINASEFSGDFSLAMSIPGVDDLLTGNGTSQQALTSLFGSGNDSYDWMSVEADLVSSDKDYYISMGSGDDTVTVTLDGDSVDALGESFSLNAGAGDDNVTLDRNDGNAFGVSQTTMRLLDNIDIDLSSGDDVLDMDNNFNANIDAGDGDDFVYMNAGNANGNGTGDAITIGQWTGVQSFGERVLYNADLTISYAGFEATVDIDTISADGFVADQSIINDAVMEAINTDPVLSELLTVTLNDGTQMLTITPAHTIDEDGNITLPIDGANSIGIAIYQPTLVTANAGDGEVVLSSGDLASVEAGFIATNNLHNTTNTLVNTLDSDDFVNVATAVAAVRGLNWEGAVNELGVGDNAIYTEIETDVELTRGAQTSDILDDSADNYLDYTTIGSDSTTGFNLSSINMGTGTNDIVVMHSNDNNAGVLEFDGTFGKVSVVNWHGSVNNIDEATHTIANATDMGFNATDFTALLDNQIDPSATTNTNSAVDVAVTTNIVAGTEAVAGVSVGVNNNNTANANSVNVIRFLEDAANSETFENLTASNLIPALNNGGTAYGNIQDNTLDAAIAANGIVIGGTAKHIIMVENSTNEGEYKVFYVESDDDATTNANGDFNEAGALELGIVDFGASVNLLQVGSTAHDSLIENLTAAIDAGAASFTYDVDGNGTVSGSEGYTIIDDSGLIDPNTPPVAVDDDAEFTVAQDGSVVINVADLLANDTDAENDTLTITSVDDAGTGDGTAVLSADGQTVTFTAADGYTGDATFTYTVSDGMYTDTADVTGSVTDDPNTAPVATDDDAAFTVAQDGSVVINVADLLANDTDAENDTLTITSVDDAGTDDGTAVLSADGQTITFTAAAGFTGAASFEYTVSDGIATDTGVVKGLVTDDTSNVFDMAAGESYTATDGVVDVFQYEVDSSSDRAVGLDGEVTIAGFNAAEDRLEFMDAGDALTDATFIDFAGVSLAENPFADNTAIGFDPEEGVSSLITIAGVQDAALDTIDFTVV